MPKLSIIVPVYKVEKYLNKCVDSILGQTYTDFEVILIDDGSPDNCGAICDEYAKKDSRVVVIHQENAGVSAARNAGLKAARGEFIGFVDSDDWIEPEMYEVMIKQAIDGEYDIVACAFTYYDEEGNKIREEKYAEQQYTKNKLLKELYGTPNEFGCSCCNKLFRNMKGKMPFFDQNIKMAEDWLYLFNYSQACESGVYINHCLYNVLERLDSATRQDAVTAIYTSIFEGRYYIYKLAQGHSTELKEAATLKYLDDCERCTNLILNEKCKDERLIGQYVRKIKVRTFRVTVFSFCKRTIPRSKVHRYLKFVFKG